MTLENFMYLIIGILIGIFLVFGDRRIRIELCRDKKRIRYVDDCRVKPLEEKGK